MGNDRSAKRAYVRGVYRKSLSRSTLEEVDLLKKKEGVFLFSDLLALLIFYFLSFHGMMHADLTVSRTV